jgi:hypothetical protein
MNMVLPLKIEIRGCIYKNIFILLAIVTYSTIFLHFCQVSY